MNLIIGCRFLRCQMSKWISVRDRLPPEKEEVLFVNDKDEVSVGHIMPSDRETDILAIWASVDGIYFNDSLDRELAVCKFWMPLPEVPLDEEKVTGLEFAWNGRFRIYE